MTSISFSPSKDPAFGWRQRGYSAGIARRPAHPPDDPEMAAAYRAGYRTAERELERRETSPEH